MGRLFHDSGVKSIIYRNCMPYTVFQIVSSLPAGRSRCPVKQHVIFRFSILFAPNIVI